MCSKHSNYVDPNWYWAMYSTWTQKLCWIQIPRVQICQITCSVHEMRVRCAPQLACIGGYAQGALTLRASYVHFKHYKQFSFQWLVWIAEIRISVPCGVSHCQNLMYLFHILRENLSALILFLTKKYICLLDIVHILFNDSGSLYLNICSKNDEQ